MKGLLTLAKSSLRSKSRGIQWDLQPGKCMHRIAACKKGVVHPLFFALSEPESVWGGVSSWFIVGVSTSVALFGEIDRSAPSPSHLTIKMYLFCGWERKIYLRFFGSFFVKAGEGIDREAERNSFCFSQT